MMSIVLTQLVSVTLPIQGAPVDWSKELPRGTQDQQQGPALGCDGSRAAKQPAETGKEIGLKLGRNQSDLS